MLLSSWITTTSLVLFQANFVLSKFNFIHITQCYKIRIGQYQSILQLISYPEKASVHWNTENEKWQLQNGWCTVVRFYMFKCSHYYWMHLHCDKLFAKCLNGLTIFTELVSWYYGNSTTYTCRTNWMSCTWRVLTCLPIYFTLKFYYSFHSQNLSPVYKCAHSGQCGQRVVKVKVARVPLLWFGPPLLESEPILLIPCSAPYRVKSLGGNKILHHRHF